MVLNQADLLGAEEVEECASDLRRLLDSEGLHHASLLVTSAVTGTGMDQLRKLLTETVHERRASAARLSADLDDVRGLVEETVLAPIAYSSVRSHPMIHASNSPNVA